MLKFIYKCIFPMIDNMVINKDIKKRIKDINESDSIFKNIENPEQINIDILKEQYTDIFKIKDKLEDKAKTNVIGVTISITLILGASTFLSNINNKVSTEWLSWLLFGLFSLSVLYMIIAGFSAIKVLNDENMVYFLSLSNENSYKEYDECIVKNRLQNTIRNNYVYTSYDCIRNSIIVLFVILIFSIFPVKRNYVTISDSNFKPYDFIYSSVCIGQVSDVDRRQAVEGFVVESINKLENIDVAQQNGIIDNERNLFIQFEITDNIIHIKDIKSFVDG